MTDDTHLVTLLRSALPPIDAAPSSRDLWPLVLVRAEEPRKWSWTDLGLAAGIAVVFVLRPDWLVLLVYHL